MLMAATQEKKGLFGINTTFLCGSVVINLYHSKKVTNPALVPNYPRKYFYSLKIYFLSIFPLAEYARCTPCTLPCFSDVF